MQHSFQRQKLQSETQELLASMEDSLCVLRENNEERELVDEVQQIVDEIRALLRRL